MTAVDILQGPRGSTAEPKPRTASTAVREGSASHRHRSGGADERLWLEAIPDVASTARLHRYCLECGAVQSLQAAKGRPLGYFERALANLKAELEHETRYPKLAQIHSHLIAKALKSIPDFGDPYSMPFEAQWTIYVSQVQRVRPDLDIDLLRNALPHERRRPRPAYIDLLASADRQVPIGAVQHSTTLPTRLRPGN